MMYIDNKEMKILDQEIFVGNFTNNGEKGHNINVSLQFINPKTEVKGYINIDAGFQKDGNIESFLNKEYIGVPFGNEEPYICIEVFDTEKFLDTEIESEIIIKLENMKDGKVGCHFEVEDDLIQIRYDGFINVECDRTRDRFAE